MSGISTVLVIAAVLLIAVFILRLPVRLREHSLNQYIRFDGTLAEANNRTAAALTAARH